jgi:exodeoxyribonuclease VII small subunit
MGLSVSKTDRTTPTTPPRDFESALSELESLVARMEAGEMSLERSLNAYKRGMELVAYCQKALNEAEQQIKILEDNQLKDFDVPREGPSEGSE